MRASDLAEQIPTVRTSTTGAEAARVVAEYRFPGVVVADDAGVPIAVIPGSQLLALVLPQYVRDDPALAHAFDETGADSLCRKLNRATVGELLDAQRLKASKPPSVLPEDTLIEVASVMVEEHHPLILVIDREGRYHGTVHDVPGARGDRDRRRTGQRPGPAQARTRRRRAATTFRPHWRSPKREHHRRPGPDRLRPDLRPDRHRVDQPHPGRPAAEPRRWS